LSANTHELEQTIDVLVLVKAYPQPSTKYTESVCVAGLRLDTPVPGWVRLYPVPFRLLKRERQFSKYDLIRVLVRRLQIWLSAEQRLDRAHTGELRRGGLAVVLERAIPAPEESRCLFAVAAASKRVVERAAELAQLSPVGIAEARG
jgi:hypothetical protein